MRSRHASPTTCSTAVRRGRYPICGGRDMGIIDAAEVRLTEDEASVLEAAIP
jgi:hypothetical protein